MAKNYIQPGEVLTLTAPAVTGCKSGDMVLSGALIGVAAYDAAAGEEVEVSLEGVWTLPKAAGALTEGQLVFWSVTDGNVKNASGAGLYRIGTAVRAAGSGDPTCRVRLDGIAVTAVPA